MIADEIRAELYGGPRDGEQIDLGLEPPAPGARPEPPEHLAQPNEPPRSELMINLRHPAVVGRPMADGVAEYELIRGDGAYPNWMLNSSGRLMYAYVRPARRRRWSGLPHR